MKNVTVKLKVDQQKYEAAQQFMDEKGLDMEQELSKTVEGFYKKYVPSAVQKYIEKTSPSTRSPTMKSATVASNKPPQPGSSEPDLSMDFEKSGSTGFNEA
ncbi:hypothetical protein [Caproiciproducens galactitolivorans]|uniref:RelB antitoxin n=1 Tax=Caproiciproducens galactitolivorans TaxID=642589 RepID=A0ABT4BRG6_9FIRM|nr:hypothetical protein [Caproiciproducens galactitolivorans]MCY1713385.1 hypothetical protein [Caproiciproducens galactitolivorans]